MSDVVISKYIDTQKQLYEDDKESLKNTFNNSLDGIIKRVKGLNHDFKSDILTDIESLEQMSKNLVNSFTFDVFQAESSTVDTITNTFNNKFLQASLKYERLMLEQEAIIKRI